MLGIVGTAVIKSLQNIDHQLDLSAGITDVVADKNKLDGFTIKFPPFDFTDFNFYQTALDGCDILFYYGRHKFQQYKKTLPR